MRRLVVIALVMLMAGLALAARYDDYKQARGDRDWHVKLNSFVGDVGTDVDDLYTLYNSSVTTESMSTFIPETPAYVDADTFTVPGDYTSYFGTGKHLLVDLGADGVKGNTVASSSYAGGTTTVDLDTANLTANLSAVYVSATRDGLWPYGPGYIVARDYGAPGQAALDAALAAIGSLKRTLVLTPGDWTITSDDTIPSNVHLLMFRGARLDIADGVTLTINGPLTAGLYQVFSWAGTGKVVFGDGAVTEVYPEWWGPAVEGEQAALDAALTAIGSLKRTLVLTPGDWTITTNDTIPSNVLLVVQHGGSFDIADGVTLTINGPFTAGLYQVFSWTGSGKVVFGDGAIDWAYPEWWGAVGDGTTDSSAAIQAAFDAWPRVKLVKGEYIWNSSSPLYLNSTDSGIQYLFYGAGVYSNTKLKFPNIGASAYCIKVNEDSGGSKVVNYPTNPRLILKHMRIYGNTTNYPDLLKVRQTGVWLENLQLSDFTDGVETTEYCDSLIVRKIIWRSGPPNGVLLRQGSNGDAWTIENVFVDNYYSGAGLHERYVYWGSNGSNHVFKNIVGGMFRFSQTLNILIEGWHCEDTGTSNPLYIDGAVVTIKNSNWWNTKDFVPIKIDDSDDYRVTNLVLEDCSFVSYIDNASDTRQNDIYIGNLNRRSSIVLSNVASFAQASGHWMLEHAQMGIRIASDISGIDSAVKNLKNWRLLTNARIYRRSGVWQVEPLEGYPVFHGIDTAGLYWIGAVSTYPSSLAAGTYYYKVAIYYDDKIHTAASSEYSATVTSGQAVEMQAWLRGGCAILRIWRGTSSGNYDRYVDIPVAKYDYAQLHDQGGSVYGFPWITTDVPTPPSDNTTMEGYEMANGKRIFWASAAPTSSEFDGVQGDIVWNTGPSAGETPGWVCVTAGSPGTWKAMANLAN